MSRQQRRAIERRNKKSRRAITLIAGEGVSRAIALTFALVTSSASAEEAEKKEEFVLPPVIVREQPSPYYIPQSSLSRFPEPLKDTPQSITIVPQRVIEEQAGTTLRDALRNVTGIGIAAGEGGGAQGDGFTLRGFNARNDMFIDGVRDQGSYFRDSFNLEAVEVIKGPSSTYFGRGSTGGIINQVSKSPRLDPSYNGIFSGGTDLFFRGTADVNQPLTFISPTAALRVNLMAHRNDIAERDVVENTRFGFAPSIAFGLGTPTEFRLSYLIQHEDNLPDYGFPFAPNGKPIRFSRENFYGLAKEDYERTLVNIGTARLDHHFNDNLSLRNTLRFSHGDREAAPTIPGFNAALATITRNHVERDTQESILSNQTDLTAKFSTLGFKHTLTTGVEISRESFDVLRYNYNGEPADPNPANPNPNPNTSGMTRVLAAKSDTTAFGFGIFAADQLRLNDYFDVVGGIRWDYFSTSFDDKRNIPTARDFNRIDRMLSYRGGLVFHPTLSQSYYFSYGTSFNPSAEALSLSANNQETAPEKNRILEIGAKLGFMGGALGLQGALFRIDKTNARVSDPVTGLQVLEGKQRVQGVEVGVAGRILPGWNVFAGYTFLDSEFRKSTDPTVVGNKLQNVPEHSATLWTTYDFLDKWQIGGGPTYVGSRFANSTNTNRVDGYVRWDATVAYKLTEKIQLRLNAQNLTNEFYFESVHPSHVVPGAGRTFIVSTSVNF
ncbi:MAG TPA: TonB-dependent siderophore receptor [Candidatus Eisenbacteria bacterium]|nr:TonB-dependent siderophore receptor [Candidatus Eisenbacteria bacterium]